MVLLSRSAFKRFNYILICELFVLQVTLLNSLTLSFPVKWRIVLQMWTLHYSSRVIPKRDYWWWPAWDHNKWMREWAWVKHKKLLLHKNDLAVQNWLCWVYCAITTGRLQDERQNESALLDCKKLVTSIL